METLKFKTNIKCGGCMATVKPVLDTLPGITAWEVDMNSADKILSVKAGDGLTAAAVTAALEKVGYSARPAAQ